jgi:hypothetical protein
MFQRWFHRFAARRVVPCLCYRVGTGRSGARGLLSLIGEVLLGWGTICVWGLGYLHASKGAMYLGFRIRREGIREDGEACMALDIILRCSSLQDAYSASRNYVLGNE